MNKEFWNKTVLGNLQDENNGFDEDFDTYNFVERIVGSGTNSSTIYENITYSGYTVANLTFKATVTSTGGTASYGVDCRDNDTDTWIGIEDFNTALGETGGLTTKPIPSTCIDTENKVELKHQLVAFGNSESRYYESQVDYWNLTFPENVSMEIGVFDGTREMSFTGVYNINNQTVNLSTNVNNYTNTCTEDSDGFYNVPIFVITDTSGIIQISALINNYTYEINPVILNSTLIEDYLKTQSNFTEIKITIENGNNGSIKVDDIKFDYVGGNFSYEVKAHNEGYTNNATHNVTFFYSDWDYSLPSKTSYIEFIPSTPTKKNVSPRGQKASTPLLDINFTNYGGKNMNFSIQLNETDPNNCVDLWVSNTSNKDLGFNMSNGVWYGQTINQPYLYNLDLWFYADYQCDYTSWRYWQPEWFFLGCCYECDVCDQETS